MVIKEIIETLFKSKDFEYKINGDEIGLFCPFHKQEKYNSHNFFINHTSGSFKCWNEACGKKGSFEVFLKLFDMDHKIKDLKILKLMNLGDKINKYIFDNLHKGEEALQQRIRMNKLFVPMKQYRPPEFIQFLIKRKLGRKICEKFQVHVCVKGYYRNRVIFPIIMDEKLHSFGARDITGQALKKILYPKGTKLTKILYGYHGQETVILVEGIIDCLWLKQLGWHQAVSTFACHLTTDQFRQMYLKGTKRFIFLFDNDPAGIKGSEKAIKTHCKPYKVEYGTGILPEGKDPNECTESELKAVLGKISIFKITSRWKRQQTSLSEGLLKEKRPGPHKLP